MRTIDFNISDEANLGRYLDVRNHTGIEVISKGQNFWWWRKAVKNYNTVALISIHCLKDDRDIFKNLAPNIRWNHGNHTLDLEVNSLTELAAFLTKIRENPDAMAALSQSVSNCVPVSFGFEKDQEILAKELDLQCWPIFDL